MKIFSIFRKNILIWSAVIFGCITAAISIYSTFSSRAEKEIEVKIEVKSIINETFDLLEMKPASAGVLSWGHIRGEVISTPAKRQKLEKVRRNIEQLEIISSDNEDIPYLKLAYIIQFGDIKTLENYLSKREMGIPKHIAYAFVGGMISNYSDSINLSRKYYNKSIDLEPKDSNVRAMYGLQLHSFKFNDEAIIQLKESIRLNPTNIEYKNTLAHVLAENEQLEEAYKLLKQSIDSDIANAGTYNGLGAVYSFMGKHDEAIAMYKKAIERYPSYGIYYYNLSLAYKELGDDDNALKYRKLAEDTGDMHEKLFKLEGALH